MLKLMQPFPALPLDHPLLHYQYNESDKWAPEEIEIFQQALFRFDKDFFNIAREVCVLRFFLIIHLFLNFFSLNRLEVKQPSNVCNFITCGRKFVWMSTEGSSPNVGTRRALIQIRKRSRIRTSNYWGCVFVK